VLRTEPRNKYDQGECAILELVDGPRDVRFMMTALAIARDEQEKRKPSEITKDNIRKVTQFRKDGKSEFQKIVDGFKNKWPSWLQKDPGLAHASQREERRSLRR
jgi:large subunit ribosomal protein L17